MLVADLLTQAVVTGTHDLCIFMYVYYTSVKMCFKKKTMKSPQGNG